MLARSSATVRYRLCSCTCAWQQAADGLSERSPLGSRSYASEGDTEEGEQHLRLKAESKRGGRYGTKLAQTHPHLFERMRTILGYDPDEEAGSLAASYGQQEVLMHPRQEAGSRSGRDSTGSGDGASSSAGSSTLHNSSMSSSTSSAGFAESHGAHAPFRRIQKVTISNLQTMRYLQIDPDHNADLQLKRKLAGYRVATLSRELVPLLQQSHQFLAHCKEEALAFRPDTLFRVPTSK